MKLVKPSGILGKRKFCDYFSHVGQRGEQNLNEQSFECTHGGESLIHRMAKQKLREMVGRYSFVLFQCRRCGDERSENGDGCSVTIEVCSGDGRWRYDCVLVRYGVPAVAMEIVHLHKTGELKINAVRSSGLDIAEFRADDIMQLGDGEVLENLQIRRGGVSVFFTIFLRFFTIFLEMTIYLYSSLQYFVSSPLRSITSDGRPILS